MGQSYDLSDYLAMARRQWWIVALALIAGAGTGADYNRRLPREYTSVASVLVYPVGQDADASIGSVRAEIDLGTEAQLVRSAAVTTDAARTLNRDDIEQLAASIDVEVPPNTAVLRFKFTDHSAHGAQAGARAFADSYLRNRGENAAGAAGTQIEAIKVKVAELTNDLALINSQVAGVSRGSPAFASLDSQRETILATVNQLNNRITQLGAETFSGGVIIQDAPLPGKPVRPNTPVNIAVGGLLGLLFGVALGGLRQRLDKRVRSVSELRGRCGVPVLSEIAEGQVHPDDVFPPFGEGGRAFNRLGNEVIAALNPGEQVVVVTGASGGQAVTHVAANLAAALARTGIDVVLVGANAPKSMSQGTSLARLLGVAPTPGLSDVLAGQANLGEATQRAARNPTLRVITPGRTGNATGMLQSQVLRDIITTLRAHTGYVVIEAPSTSTGAATRSLAGLADAAIIAVELKRSRRPDIADASEQLRRAGTPVLGAIALPRLKPASGRAEPMVPHLAGQDADGDGRHPPRHEPTMLMSTLDSNASG